MLRIRKVTSEDAALLARMHMEYALEFGLSVAFDNTLTDISSNLENLSEDPDYCIFGAEGKDGRLLGYANVHWVTILHYPKPEGFVTEMLVAKAHRGKGIGTHLLKEVESAASAKGCHKLFLHNYRAMASHHRGFYRKHGYIEEDLSYFSKILKA